MAQDVTQPRRITLISLYLIAMAGAAGVLGTGGWWLYSKGSSNQDREITFLLVLGAGLLLSILAVVALIVMIALYHERKPRLAGHAAAAMCVMIFLAGAAWIFAPSRFTAYERGFERWVAGHVDEQAILAWHASLPPSATVTVQVLWEHEPPAVTETPPTQWPAAISSLAPKRVNRLANGVMLEWGSFANWGHARRAFISTDNVDPIGTEPNKHFQYNQIEPGLWAAVQAIN